MFMELKAGNLDRMGLNAIQYSRQTEYPKFQRMYNKYRYMPFSYIYLGYNLNDSRFADRRVRQALTHAINKQEIIEGVLMGLGEEATGPYKPGTWYYNPNVPKFPYDPAKAKALLAAAGWTPNADGVLTKDGAPFAFTILTNQGNDTRQRTAEIIQSRLRAVGILVKIRQVEWAAFLKEFIEKGRFEAILLGWNTGLDPDQFDIWSSTKTKPGELNVIGYKNPEVDALVGGGAPHLRPGKAAAGLLPLPGDRGRGPALHLPLRPRRPARHLQALPGHQTGPRRHRLQLHQVVRSPGRAEVHHEPVLRAVPKSSRFKVQSWGHAHHELFIIYEWAKGPCMTALKRLSSGLGRSKAQGLI